MKKLILGFLIAAMGLLVFCSRDDRITNQANETDTVLVSATVLFKSANVQTVPDSVTTIRLTVTYGSVSNVESFDYRTHLGTIHTIPARTAFTLKIEGLDGAGVVIFTGSKDFSGLTADLTVEITASEVTPRAPSDLLLEAVSSSAVKIDWHDNSSNEQGFIIECSPVNDSHFVAIDTTIPNRTTLTNASGLLPATVYYYRIRGFNSAGVSPCLTAQSVKTMSSIQIDSIAPSLFVSALPESVSVESVTVIGKAYDASGISCVIVNTDTAILNADSTFASKIKLPLGRDTIRVTAIDNSQRKNDSVVILIVVYDPTVADRTPPVITFTNPRKADTVKSLAPFLTGTVNDAGGTISSFKINSVSVTPIGINWSRTVTLTATGWNSIFFEAVDGRGNVKLDTLTLFVDTTTPDTVAPSISFGSYAPGYMFNTTSVTFNVTVMDNGSGVDSVYIGSVIATTAGSSVYGRSITLTPDSSFVRVEAKDKKGNRKKDSLLVILNRPPQFTTTIVELKDSAIVGVLYKDTVVASDLDGIAGLSYQKKAGPSDMTVNNVTGAISWMPSSATVVKCTVTVTDKYQYKDTISWAISAIDTAVVVTVTPDSMVSIAGGTFQMGSLVAADEQPVRSVTISAFTMSNTEVTQAEYLRVMGFNPSSITGDLKKPVENLTWFDAVLFCNKRSKMEGKDTVYSYTGVTGAPGNGCSDLVGITPSMNRNGYRLPTEAEWEFAYRAATSTDYYWGLNYPPVTVADSAAINTNCWWVVNSASTSHPVATKIANPWRLFDMGGNVWEWCHDWYGNYIAGAQSDPTGAGSGSKRISRGGSWSYGGCNLIRSSVRNSDLPGDRSNFLGFRLVVHPISSAQTNNLVAFYSFAGNAVDSSGKGNNGTVNGATLAQDRFAVNEQAYAFDGNDYVDCGSGVDFRSLVIFTVSAWVKTSNQNGYKSICSRDVDGAARVWQLVRNEQNKVHLSTFYNSTSTDTCGSKTLINDNLWHFIVGVRSADSLFLYVDGKRENARKASGKLVDGNQSGSVFIGAARDLISHNWVGSLDDVRIFKVALSLNQIDSLCRLGGWAFTAPAITTQPTPKTVTVGQSASFTVVATGNPAPTYQWKKGTTEITGATSATFTIPVTVSGDAGSYTVVVMNSQGIVTSSTVTLTVKAIPVDSMIHLTGGTYQMGSTTLPDEQPVHSVTITGLWVSNTEVTQGEYFRVMGVNPSKFTGDVKRPVENVTWFDAVLYCNKRSKMEGKDTVYTYTSFTGTAGDGCSDLMGLNMQMNKNGYRLPTEAEWEYSCRAGTLTDYYWGGGDTNQYAWFSSNSGQTAHPVAMKIPNAFSLYDMSGNVWEWCNDWYGSYPSTGQIDPTGPISGTYRVLRGGSYVNGATNIPSVYRNDHNPSRDSCGGFRVVLHPLTSVGMKIITGGTFQMGSTVLPNEQPLHSVTISTFYMDTTEVTQADYFAITNANPSYFTGDMNRPVEQVTWFDAVLYCNARSKRSGRDTVYSYISIVGTPFNGCTGLTGISVDIAKNGYRLPTEAEWEYACRAGTTTDYYWGKNYPLTGYADTVSLDSNAISWHNSYALGSSSPDYGTHKVGSKKSNAFGLYDMSGNVWEWCNDRFGSYSAGSLINPTGPTTGSDRVLRGASWFDFVYCGNGIRSAYREIFNPISLNDRIGFRVVRSQ